MENFSSHRIEYLFKKYVNNSCSGDELEEFLECIGNADNRMLIEQQLHDLWSRPSEKASVSKLHWEELYNQLLSQAERKTPVNAHVYKMQGNRKHTWMFKAAAAIIVIVGIGWLITGRVNVRKNKTPDIASSVKQTPVHQTIILPDGSTVILNKDSKLDYPANFDASTREVYLTGEAYFDVKHIRSKPFMVHTGNITTKVLGTAFNIKAYHADGMVSVTVTRGKVQVLNHDKSLGIIIPNQQIVFNVKTLKAEKILLDAKIVTAWKEEDLIMDDITLNEAALLLTNKYGVKINFANEKIKNCRFTASFLSNSNLQQILTVICDLNKVKYQWENADTILIDGKGCSE